MDTPIMMLRFGRTLPTGEQYLIEYRSVQVGKIDMWLVATDNNSNSEHCEFINSFAYSMLDVAKPDRLTAKEFMAISSEHFVEHYQTRKRNEPTSQPASEIRWIRGADKEPTFVYELFASGVSIPMDCNVCGTPIGMTRGGWTRCWKWIEMDSYFCESCCNERIEE